ncbi:MAG: hypothetical protein U0528_13375 [Anaerolineae bacterium]
MQILARCCASGSSSCCRYLPDELRRAILGPAEANGLRVESALVTTSIRRMSANNRGAAAAIRLDGAIRAP